MNKHSIHAIAVYALLVLAAPLVFAPGANAQTVPGCPAGYVCTPINQAKPQSYSNGFYYSNDSYYSSPTANGFTPYNTSSSNTSSQNTSSQAQIYNPNPVNTGNAGDIPPTAQTCFFFTKNLTVGSYGEDVAALQRFLISKGYYIASVTSYFGSQTNAALKSYQASKGIAEDGFGPITRSAVNASCGGTIDQPVTTPIPIPTSLYHSADLNHDWRIDDSELAAFTRLYNYYSGTTRTGEYHSTVMCTQSIPGVCTSSYDPGPGARIGATHSGDSNHDWMISLSELTRVIELKNAAGGYKVQAGTEDGFAPITGATTAATITVLSPNGGETYKPGDTVNVQWRTANAPYGATVGLQLLYTTDAGTSYEDVITSYNPSVTTGSYSWTIPSKYATGMKSNLFKIRALLYSNGTTPSLSVGDYSDGYFTIGSGSVTDPVVTVTAPWSGGEKVTLGTYYNIKWTDTAYKSGDWYTVYIVQQNGNAYGVAGHPVYGTSFNWRVGDLLPGTTNGQSLTPNNTYYIQIVRQSLPHATSANSPFYLVSTITPPTINDTDLSIPKVVKASFHPYGFTMTLCMAGSQSINDIKKTNSRVTYWPGDITVYDRYGAEYKAPATSSGYVEDMKNGQCQDIGITLQSNQYAAFDQTKKALFRVDNDNVIPETNENNNSFTYSEAVTSASCTDSDGGININVAGLTDARVNGVGSYFNDSSVGSNGGACSGDSCTGVAEGYCDGNTVTNRVYQCPSGYSVNGACATKPAVSNYPGMYINFDKSTYLPGETVRASFNRADSSLAPYGIDIAAVKTTDIPSATLIVSNLQVGGATTKEISLNQYPFTKGPGQYLIIACQAGKSCSVPPSNSNYFTIASAPVATPTPIPTPVPTPAPTPVAAATPVTPVLSRTSWYADDASTWPTVSESVALNSNQAMRVKGMTGDQYFNQYLGVTSGKITSTPPVGTTQLELYVYDYATGVKYGTQTVNINVTNKPVTSAPVTGTQSVRAAQTAMDSGATQTLYFTMPSNTVSSKLYISCPPNVSIPLAAGANMCNTWQDIGVSTNFSFNVVNSTTMDQTLNPNYYIYTADRPTFGVGVSTSFVVRGSDPSVLPQPQPSAQRDANASLNASIWDAIQEYYRNNPQ